jgi:hypothetical protein
MVATERRLALPPAGSHQCHVAGVGTRPPWAEDFATVVDRAASTRTRAHAELNHIWQLARSTKCKTSAREEKELRSEYSAQLRDEVNELKLKMMELTEASG